jgi:hypothetical protein
MNVSRRGAKIAELITFSSSANSAPLRDAFIIIIEEKLTWRTKN